MQNKAYLAGTVFLLSLCTLPLAQAHNVASESATVLTGLSHPLLGWDHLLVALAVGLWATQQAGRPVWRLPVIFLGVMTVAALAGSTGLPAVEAGIAVSVLTLGLLLALAARPPMIVSTLLVTLFALVQGLSHGIQTPPATSAMTYVAGLTLTTALLHVFGIQLGRLSRGAQHGLWLRLGGGAIAASSVLAWV